MMGSDPAQPPGTNKRCSRCGEWFDCGAGRATCWCVAEKVPQGVLAELRGKYPDCLCPKCLRQAAESPGPARDE